MSDGRKRLSGAEYRKRKTQKEENVKKITTPISNYFTSTSTSSHIEKSSVAQENFEDSSSSTIHFNEVSIAAKKRCLENSSFTTGILNSSLSSPEETNKSVCITSLTTENSLMDSINEYNFDDPGKWPLEITDNLKMFLTEVGPKQIYDFNFPKDERNRSFSADYYYKRLSNNEKMHRNWLLYSKCKNSVYCFPCKLFNDKTNAFNCATGYCDWNHLSRTLESHEKSEAHIKCYKSWVDFKKSLINNNTIDAVNEQLIKLEKNRWRSVIERIIYIVQFLAGQNLAFRGNNNKLFEDSNGNFLKLVETIAKFDNVTADHISRIQTDKDKMPHYLGEKIQNEIISIIGEKIKSNIVKMLKSNKYYAIILDTTPDASHENQLSVVVRFVNLDNDNKKIEIREHFLGFYTITNSTGEGLTNFIVDFLKSENINLYDLRAQAYDNGANMKGKNQGLQKRILDMNPRAFYVPCAAHTLNLVINDAASIPREIANFFFSP